MATLPAGPPKLSEVLNSLGEVAHASEISLMRNARFCIVHIDFSLIFQNHVYYISCHLHVGHRQNDPDRWVRQRRDRLRRYITSCNKSGL